MGQILANSEIQSQKERPASASEMPPAMVELLEEAVSLWEDYILQCLHPDRKVAAKHAQRIANSLKVICRSLFQHCTREEAHPFLTPLLRQLWQAEGAREQFILADALCQVPLAWLPAEALPPTAAALGRMLQAGQDSLALAALRCLEQLRLQRPEDGAAAAAPLAEVFVPPAGAAWARSSPTSLAAATKKGWQICRRIPTPSPVWPEASFPARCSRCSTISRASSTVWREGRPHRSTTAPMPQASCPRFSGFILHICSLIDSHPIHQSHKNGTRFWMASQPTQKKQHPFSEVFTWFSPVFLTVILHFLRNFPPFSAMRPTCFRAPFPLLSLSFLHDSRLLLALLKILLSKNAKRAQAAACAQNKRLPPLPGRSVLDGRASAGSAPLDHRPVGRPMIRRQRRTPSIRLAHQPAIRAKAKRSQPTGNSGTTGAEMGLPFPRA